MLVRDPGKITVYLNGNSEPEIQQTLAATSPVEQPQFYVGGRSDNADNWEGRLDEIAVFDRPLTLEEVRDLSLSQN